MATTDKPIPSTPATAHAGGSAGVPPVKPVASASPAASAPNSPAGAPGAKSLPKIGDIGYAFLHPVDSPQGQEERREHERLRKANKRDAARAVVAAMAQPAPLPPPSASLANQLAPQSGVEGPGVSSAPLPTGDAPAVPWKPELLTNLLDELMKAAEESRVAAFVGKCEEAGITGKLLDEIEKDAHFPKGAKILLKESLPRLAAKWLNRSGISAEYQDEAAVITAILLIVSADRKNSSKLDELIAQRKAELEKVMKNATPAVLPDPPQPFGAPPVLN